MMLETGVFQVLTGADRLGQIGHMSVVCNNKRFVIGGLVWFLIIGVWGLILGVWGFKVRGVGFQ